MSLFLLVDLPLEFAVDTADLVLAFILQAVLEQSRKVMEQTDRSHRRRPVLIALDAVQELLGVLIAVLCGSSQIVNSFVICYPSNRKTAKTAATPMFMGVAAVFSYCAVFSL